MAKKSSMAYSTQATINAFFNNGFDSEEFYPHIKKSLESMKQPSAGLFYADDVFAEIKRLQKELLNQDSMISI